MTLTVTIAPLPTPVHRATTSRFCVIGLWRDAKYHASRAVEYVLCNLPANEANYVQPLAKPLRLCSLVDFPNPDDLRLIDGLEGFGDITTITSRCVQCEKQISTMPAFVPRPVFHGSQFVMIITIQGSRESRLGHLQATVAACELLISTAIASLRYLDLSLDMSLN